MNTDVEKNQMFLKLSTYQEQAGAWSGVVVKALRY